ncbi:MAG: hypothetical protein NZ828_10620 [Alphaproteobacteria bacterium]|nr:hypothetical protein [Alphaproteobacteria bacterium]
MASKPVPFMAPSRTVLMMTDESLAIYNVRAGFVRLEGVVPWVDEQFIDKTLGVLSKKCSGSVLLLNDMVEQHYRKEKLPKVGALDRTGVIRRKLAVVFPNHPVRAALAMKSDKKQPGDYYLFTGVPVTQPFKLALESINKSYAQIFGYATLPVESAGMISELAQSLAKETKRKKSKWVVFIGQHVNGGLRQIVTKDGELALTRITPIVDSDIDPGLWASEVSQEFTATMSYLSRFGYAQEDGLDVIVISNPEASQALEAMITVSCYLTVLTVAEAAKKIGVRIGAQDDMRLADPLHVAWAGRKAVLDLPLKSKDLDAIMQPRQIANGAMMLATVSFLAAIYFVSITGQKLYQVDADIKLAQEQRVQVENMYKREVESKKKIGIDLDKFFNAINLYNDLSVKNFDTLAWAKDVTDNLGHNIRFDDFSIRYVAPPSGAANRYNQSKGHIEANLSMSFPPEVEVELGNVSVKALRARLEKHFGDDYKVLITKELQDLASAATFSDEVGYNVANVQQRQVSRQRSKADLTASIMIRKDLK